MKTNGKGLKMCKLNLLDYDTVKVCDSGWWIHFQNLTL